MFWNTFADQIKLFEDVFYHGLIDHYGPNRYKYIQYLERQPIDVNGSVIHPIDRKFYLNNQYSLADEIDCVVEFDGYIPHMNDHCSTSRLATTVEKRCDENKTRQIFDLMKVIRRIKENDSEKLNILYSYGLKDNSERRYALNNDENNLGAWGTCTEQFIIILTGALFENKQITQKLSPEQFLSKLLDKICTKDVYENEAEKKETIKRQKAIQAVKERLADNRRAISNFNDLKEWSPTNTHQHAIDWMLSRCKPEGSGCVRCGCKSVRTMEFDHIISILNGGIKLFMICQSI